MGIFCHAVERGDRRTALLEELPRYTTYKMEFATREGLLPAIVLMILPFVILGVLIRLLPPWGTARATGALTPRDDNRPGFAGLSGAGCPPPAATGGGSVNDRLAALETAIDDLRSSVRHLEARLARLEGRAASAEAAEPMPVRPRPARCRLKPLQWPAAGAIRSPCSRSPAASSSCWAGRTCSAP